MTYQEPAGRERRGELFIASPAEAYGGALQVQNLVLAHLKSSKPGSEDGENLAPAWHDIRGERRHQPRPLPAPHLRRATNAPWHGLAGSGPVPGLVLPQRQHSRSRVPHFGIRQLHSQAGAGTNFRDVSPPASRGSPRTRRHSAGKGASPSSLRQTFQNINAASRKHRHRTGSGAY